MQKVFKHYLLLFFLCLASVQVFSQQVIELKRSEGLHHIGRQALVYEDHSINKGISEIVALSPDSFRLANEDLPNFNVTKAGIWLKIRLTTQERGQWMIEAAYSSIVKVNFYSFKKGVQTSAMKSGIKVPTNERTLLGGHILFETGLLPGDTMDCYLRFENEGPLVTPLKAGDITEFFNQDHYENFLHGAYFGIMLLMVLYNLFLYFTNRDVVYVYYILYIVFSALFIAFFLGYVLMMPTWLRYVFSVVPVFIPACFGFFGLLFTIRFLNTKKHAPRLHKFIIVFLWLVTLPVFIAFSGFAHESVGLIQVFGVILALLCLATGITVLKKGYRPAKFYVFGFGAYMIGLLILIITNVSHYSIGGLERYALELGSAIEAVMLSFAIGDKLNIANIERQKAQAQTLVALQENERLIKEQNAMLERKVKERTIELEEQKEIVEEKNKEIVDSINYAKRIQYTLLAHDQFLNEHLPEHFVLFKPKDIVSGDFYWATSVGGEAQSSKLKVPNGASSELQTPNSELFYLAVCDSTGHGVPGAFMSLLNISLLNEAITERKLKEPNKIFDHVRARLIESISKEGQQDGFDGLLLMLERNGQEINVQYAAANNPPVLVRNGSIEELNADKMPVGKGERTDAFSLHTIRVQKGDLLVLYTDGYADQFGGPKGKKFKYKQLDKLVLDNSAADLKQLKQTLETTFDEWKGDLEQVDDVCIIGIRF
ncbi:MAG: protein serine/threonine phosphatase [Bacteroidetes bacterium]|nr:protein serine/threonine phosphatase [Bacteroidota bacterium]